MKSPDGPLPDQVMLNQPICETKRPVRDLSASREMLDDFNVQPLELKRGTRANVP
jgi:hypothetical protein